MSTNNSPGRTVRLNTALNTALIKNEYNQIRETNAIPIHNKHKQTHTNTNTMKRNQAEQINENVNGALCVKHLCN